MYQPIAGRHEHDGFTGLGGGKRILRSSVFLQSPQQALLDTLSVDTLRIPERIVKLIPPTAFGYGGLGATGTGWGGGRRWSTP